MSKLPNIRIARITYLSKYNKTQSAADVHWIWKEFVREELQFQNKKGEWEKVPVVEIRDESAKEKEEAEKKQKQEKKKKDENALFDKLKSLENPKNHWEPMDHSKFGYFLDAQNASFCSDADEDGYYCYYSKDGKVAKSRNNSHFVRGDVLMKWVDPDRDLATLREIFDRIHKTN